MAAFRLPEWDCEGPQWGRKLNGSYSLALPNSGRSADGPRAAAGVISNSFDS